MQIPPDEKERSKILNQKSLAQWMQLQRDWENSRLKKKV